MKKDGNDDADKINYQLPNKKKKIDQGREACAKLAAEKEAMTKEIAEYRAELEQNLAQASSVWVARAAPRATTNL